MDVSENSGFSPQIIHFNRVFHYFHHPFLGVFPLIFGNTHISLWFPKPLTTFRPFLTNWKTEDVDHFPLPCGSADGKMKLWSWETTKQRLSKQMCFWWKIELMQHFVDIWYEGRFWVEGGHENNINFSKKSENWSYGCHMSHVSESQAFDENFSLSAIKTLYHPTTTTTTSRFGWTWTWTAMR